MIEIFLLEQLVTFAKHGTLSKAAEELHITQPALSRSMKKLENELGISLFNRDKSKISLNETGKIATEYAKKVLDADREMIEKTILFDRSRRTIAVGTCAFLPVNTLMPLLQEHFSQKAIITEITEDSILISRLKSHSCQLAILHTQPDDKNIFCEKYFDEQLYISLPSQHPLASHKELAFSDLTGMSILAHGNSGFWIDICKENLKNSKLLVQNSLDMLHELVNSSSLPVFYSNRAAKLGYAAKDRVAIPLIDKNAQVTYYLACLDSEKEKYISLYNSLSHHPI